MIIVGIDVASEKHDYFMLHQETGTVFSASSVTIGNDEEGYKKTPQGYTILLWSYR